MARIEIDTTDPQYQQLYNGLDLLRERLRPLLPLYRRLPLAKRRLWRQRDPLLKRTLILARDVGDFLAEAEDAE